MELNRWARRHRDDLVDELEEGEELLAAGRVLIGTVRPPPSVAAEREIEHGLGPMLAGRQRRRIARTTRGKVRAAHQAGFPAPGPLFVLGVTNRRIVIWRPSSLLGRPAGIITEFPVRDISAMRLVRRLGPSRLALTLPSGAIVVLQNLWCRALPAIAAAHVEAKQFRSS